MKMTAYDMLKKQLGEDPRQFQKREEILISNQNKRHIYT